MYETVTQQPFVQKSDVDVRLPTGLKVLQTTNEVTVIQHVDPVEVVLCCINRPCRYSVYAKDAEEQFLYIQEECFARQIIGAARGFTLKFSDNDLLDTIHAIRPQTCSRGCCGTCCRLPWLQIEAPPGHALAIIKEKKTCCYPSYEICDLDGSRLFSLSPSCCYVNMASDVCIDPLYFPACKELNIPQVLDEREERIVAKFSKQTKLNGKECIGLENNFKLQYTVDLPLNDKVILLGAVFLIDFHYFEKQQRYCC